MSKTKLDYGPLEREFITTDISLRDMAKREGVSNSTVSDYARRNKWEDKREAFKAEVEGRYLKTAAESRARQLSRLADQSVTVLEMALTRLAIQLTGKVDEDGNVEVPPMEVPLKEGLEVIRQIQTLRGLPSNITEERQVVGHLADPRLLEALGNLAREQLGRSGASGDPVLALSGPVERRPEPVEARAG